MKLLSRRSALALLASVPATALAAGGLTSSIRFGLTAVVVLENVAFFDKWAAYLEKRLGRPVQFVQRRSYREIMALLETGEIDFAWICGYPYVQQVAELSLVAVPVFEGRPYYQSYIIVAKDSPYQSLSELSGKVFAYSDPDSNSGYLSPRAAIASRGARPDGFFRLTFFTYGHAETVEAVANYVADAGAVDSYVWEYLKVHNPALANRTRIIEASLPFGFPPVVAGRSAERAAAERMKAALLDMAGDRQGGELLRALMLDGFAAAQPEMFDGILQMARRLATAELR